MSHSPLLTTLFAAIDNKDVDGFMQHIGEKATFRFGSAPPAEGHAAIRDAVAGFFTSIAGIRHELSMTCSDGNVLVCEGQVTYTRHDSSQVSMPFANVFEIEDDLISGYRIYIDIGPLYASPA